MSFKEFKDFANGAVTRCGLPFELKTVQKNFEGEVTAVKGNIMLPNEQQKLVPQEMLWNLKGHAMMVGEQFDLVKEQSIHEVAEDTPTLIQKQQ